MAIRTPLYESLEGSFSYGFGYEFAYPIPPIGYLIGYEVDMNCKCIFDFIFPSCPIGDLIGYEIICFTRKLDMLLDMEMTPPGFRIPMQCAFIKRKETVSKIYLEF